MTKEVGWRFSIEPFELRTKWHHLRQHGDSMLKDNGWAAPLFETPAGSRRAARQPIKFRTLEEAAGLDHLRPFYCLGSHHVHAGAQASELNLVAYLPEGRAMTTGSTVYANIAETCHATLISLRKPPLVWLLTKLHWIADGPSTTW